MGKGLSMYYQLRKCLGLEQISQERLKEQEILHPNADSQEALHEEDRTRIRNVVLCLGAAIFLGVLMQFSSESGERLRVVRPDYGEAAENITVKLSVEGEEYDVPVEIDSRDYSSNELEKLWDEAFDSASSIALGNNTDWEHLQSDLNFTEETGVPGITIFWLSHDTEWISAAGEVRKLTEKEEGKEVMLTAVLSYEGQEKRREISARVVSPVWNEFDRQIYCLQQLFCKAAGDRQSETVEFPNQIDGKKIVYVTEKTPIRIILLLGVMAGIALWFLPIQRQKEEMKKRNRELELAYSELVWKLTVLMGAGLTVKGAWERILAVYRQEKECGGKEAVLYEEMQMAWNSMGQGVYEEKAYSEFGKRCGMQSYLRLGSLLETRIRQGSRGLLSMMKAESEQAFAERLQMAKSQGEEASSKLMFPMLLLFALVLALLVIPALVSFG
ncbi:MAG: hypothetical protein PUB22_04400 [Clostridiales bacterium]|nr:hypothetical protein [Clostridiales bacterium]